MKLSLFADDMIPYIENPKDSTQKLLELIKSVMFQDTKLVYISVAFLYTNNTLSSEREIKEIFPFTIASNKYLGINVSN